MSIGFLDLDTQTKPDPGTQLDPSHPLFRGLAAAFVPQGSSQFADPLGRPWTPVNAPTPVGGKTGSAFAYNGSNNYQQWSNPVLSATSCTVALRLYVAGSGQTGSTFGAGDPGTGARVQAHLPYSGTIYWDFGGSSSPNRISWTPPGGFWNSWHDLIFRAGTLGSSIWSDDVQVAGQSTAITRSLDANPFGVGAWPGGPYYNSNTVECLFLSNREWTDGEIVEWSRNPYGVYLAPTTRRFFMPSAPSSSATGTASGTSTVACVGASTAASVGSATGSATIAGVGGSHAASTGTASGSSTVAGAGGGVAASVGTGSGTSTVSGVGSSAAASVGTSSGSAAVTGVGSSSSTGSATGTAAGSASVSGVGASKAASTGSAAGSGSASGTGASTAASTGTASGVGSALATGSSMSGASGVGTASGISSVSGVGAALAQPHGTASGSSAVSGVGHAIRPDADTGTYAASLLFWAWSPVRLTPPGPTHTVPDPVETVFSLVPGVPDPSETVFTRVNLAPNPFETVFVLQ